jgi:hypothetical protein
MIFSDIVRVAENPIVERSAMSLKQALAERTPEINGLVEELVEEIGKLYKPNHLPDAKGLSPKSFQANFKIVGSDTNIQLDVPSPLALSSESLPKSAELVVKNHLNMLAITESVASKLPFVGFHGADQARVEFLERTLTSRGRDGFYTAATMRLPAKPEERLSDLYAAIGESTKYAVPSDFSSTNAGKIFVLDLTHESRPLHAGTSLAGQSNLKNIRRFERWLPDYIYDPQPSLLGPPSRNVGQFVTSFKPTNFRSVVKGSVDNADWLKYCSPDLSSTVAQPLADESARQIILARTYEVLGLIKRSN